VKILFFSLKEKIVTDSWKLLKKNGIPHGMPFIILKQDYLSESPAFLK
jgi:hypothetical protein